MWELLVTGNYSAYVELVVLSLLLSYFFLHRGDPRHRVSRVSIIRVGLIVLVYLYFLLNWSSNISAGLRNTTALGMLLINLYLLNLVIQSLLERPYRDALTVYCQEPTSQEKLNRIWRTGKRFYYLRFFIQSLFSGVFPLRFLHEMASGRILDDIQDQIHGCGGDQQFIALAGITAFLKGRLAANETLPAEFRELMEGAIDGFVSHPWIEEQVDEYLRTAVETPENIHNPDWSRMWERAKKPS